MYKSAKKSIQYMFFFSNQDNFYMNSIFSLCLLFYEPGTYCLKWLEMVQIYGGKVVARFDPRSNPEWMSSPPMTLSNVDKYAKRLRATSYDQEFPRKQLQSLE